MGATGDSGTRLLAPTPEDAKTIQLIAAYTGAAHMEASASKSDVEFVDESGHAIIGSNTICRHLARSSPRFEPLLGADAETAAMVRTMLARVTALPSGVPKDPSQRQLSQNRLLQCDAGVAMDVHAILAAAAYLRGGFADTREPPSNQDIHLGHYSQSCRSDPIWGFASGCGTHFKAHPSVSVSSPCATMFPILFALFLLH